MLYIYNILIMNTNVIKLVLFLIFMPSVIFAQGDTNWEKARNDYKKLINERKLPEAVAAAKTALEIAKSEFGEDSKYYASNYGKIGEIYFMMGDYQNAIKYLLVSKDLKKKAFGDTDIAYSQNLHNLSTLYQQMGMYREAEPLIVEAVEIKRKTLGEKDTSYAKSLHMLAELYQKTGEYKKSEEKFEAALKIKRKNLEKNNPSLAITVQGLGNLYLALGNYSEAEKCYSEIVGIYDKAYGASDPKTFAAESKLAKIYLSLGETEKAAPLLEKTQSMMNSEQSAKNPDYLDALYNSAMLQWEMKDYKAAEESLLKTLKLLEKHYSNSHYLYSSCLNSLGIINWVQGKIPEAVQYLGNATMLREQLYGKNNPILASSYHSMAGLLKEAGDKKRAKEYYKKAFDLYLGQLDNYFPFLSDNEKSKFDAKIKEHFNMFNNYVLEQRLKDPSLAADMYNYRLATKAILLNSSKRVRESIANSGNDELIKKFDNWRDTRTNLSQLYNLSVMEQRQRRVNIDSLENYANTLEKEISLISEDFKKEYKKDRIKWEDVRDKLGKDEAAIEIIRFQFFDKGWTDQINYAFLIVRHDTKDYPEMVVLDDGQKMENVYIKNYVNSMKFKMDDKDSYNFYWGKIAPKLEGIKTIYLSQDGIYNKINLNTLLEPTGKYLIESKDIVYVSNTKEIALGGTKAPKNKKLFLLGNPNFELKLENAQMNASGSRKYTISDLPGTEIELATIGDLFDKENIQVDLFDKDNATEHSLSKIQNHGIIHMATHGYFEEVSGKSKQNEIFGVDIDKAIENPLLRSGLLFSGASNYLAGSMEGNQGNNGVLTAYEAMNLNMNGVDLVVLSACDTGLGEIQNGEGVFGLQRSFLVAGAGKVMMSLWKVDDNATQELVTAFYKNLLKTDDYRSALKQAQLEQMKKHPHPYYWGAFLIIQ
jgi:CHAT domain-containing protein/Tfp pilus assembly protein PilF